MIPSDPNTSSSMPQSTPIETQQGVNKGEQRQSTHKKPRPLPPIPEPQTTTYTSINNKNITIEEKKQAAHQLGITTLKKKEVKPLPLLDSRKDNRLPSSSDQPVPIQKKELKPPPVLGPAGLGALQRIPLEKNPSLLDKMNFLFDDKVKQLQQNKQAAIPLSDREIAKHITHLHDSGLPVKKTEGEQLSYLTEENPKLLGKGGNNQVVRLNVLMKNERGKWEHTDMAYRSPVPEQKIDDIRLILKYIDKDPHCISMRAVVDFKNPNQLCGYLMPVISATDLSDHLIKTDLSLEEKISLFNQSAIALLSFHDKHCTHGDIKPANFLMGKDGLLLTDFDSAIIHPNGANSNDGDVFQRLAQFSDHPPPVTNGYVLKDENYKKGDLIKELVKVTKTPQSDKAKELKKDFQDTCMALDVLAMGVMAYQIFAGPSPNGELKVPDDGKGFSGYLNSETLNATPTLLSDEKKEELQSLQVPELYIDLIEKMLYVESTQRPTMKEVVSKITDLEQTKQQSQE